MMLLIDIGNTRIKFGWLDRQTQQRESAPLALAHQDLYAVHAWLGTLPRAPGIAVGSNVASPTLAQQLEETLHLPIRWIHSSAQAAGVRNRYGNPAQLGADRWLALIGLAAHTAQDPATPMLLANYGTATTIDTLSAQDQHGIRTFLGGLILPGPQLMRSALAKQTAGLPLAQGTAAAFPTNTDDAIVSGISAAQAGAVVQQWHQALTHLGRAPGVYVSGGDWPEVADNVQAALAQAHTVLRLAPEPVQVLIAPILDGLVQFGRVA